MSAPTVSRPNWTARFKNLRAWLIGNPVTIKELRGRMRGNRAFILLAGYVFLMSAFVTLVYAVYTLTVSSNVYSTTDRQFLGKVVFGAVVGMELLMCCFMVPAFTVGAITGERERQTYDLLRTTLLSGRDLALGKLFSALAFAALLLMAALPLQSLAFLLGGIGLEELVIATLLLMVNAFVFACLGLFFSAIMRRTLGATVLTYGFALALTGGLPILLMVLLPALSLFGSLNLGVIAQAIVLVILWVFICTNPIATMVASELILVEEQSLLGFSIPLSSSSLGTFNLPLPSPWWVFIILFTLLGLVLLQIAIVRVNRTER